MDSQDQSQAGGGVWLTPGPWTTVDHPLVSYVFTGPDVNPCCRIADVHQYGDITLSAAARKANARLIAAAPDLLDVVQSLVLSDYGRKWSWPESGYLTAIENARAAISKALGQ